jgi:integrase
MGDLVRRGTSFYVRYRDVDGVRRMRASHQPTRELARRFLVEIEARIARGKIGIPEPAAPAPTVAELVGRFLAEYRQPRIKDLQKYRRFATSNLRRALPLLGALRADAVTAADLDRLRDQLARRCAPGSAGLTFTFLKTAFAWAARGGLIARNPLYRVPLPPPREPDIEYLSADEVTALLAAADRRAAAGGVAERLLRGAVYLALHAGLRKGELFGLRWRDLDLESRRLTVRSSFATTPKGGRARHLRIPAVVVPVLLELCGKCPQTPQGLVFPRRHRGQWGMCATTGAMLGLPALLAAAGCRPVGRCWHALRHTFASHYIMQGGNILALQKILGHSDLRMTTIYAHLAPDFLGAEMDRLRFPPPDKLPI